MFIVKLDFLNSPPQMYFLGQRINKTLIGGFLFIIYIIIMMCVSTFYILDYSINDRYDIRFSLHKNFTANKEELNKIEEFNPHLNFSIDMRKLSNNLSDLNLSNQFLILDRNWSIIERNKIITRTPKDMSMIILYACLLNCSFEENNDTDLAYILNISYSGYKIDHQNGYIPLERNNDKYTFYKEFYFTSRTASYFEINWGAIKYKEDRGLFGLFDNLFKRKHEYMSIDIDDIKELNTERVVKIENKDFIIYKYKILSIIRMRNDHIQYIEYIRKKRSILDVLANIGALFSTFFSTFSFILRFYTRNFDNYKMIKELLSRPKILKINSNIKLQKARTFKNESINKNNKFFISDDNQSFDTSKSVPFKSKENSLFAKKEKEIAKDENFYYKYYLKDINFIQFFLNNVYFKRKKICKEQKIIDICNCILFKYISIEAILYNQILFENLLEDYKWNNVDLEQIGNNNLIKELKNIT